MTKRVVASWSYDGGADDGARDEVAAAWARVKTWLAKRDAMRRQAKMDRALNPPHVKLDGKGYVGGGGGGSFVGGLAVGNGVRVERDGKRVQIQVLKVKRAGKRQSSRGGESVRSNERLRLLKDWQSRMTAQGVGAMVQGVCVSADSVNLLPVSAALASGYAALPGGLFAEIQGQRDLVRCTAQAGKLLARMRADGKQTSDATGADGVGAGVAAVARWRAINAKFPARRVRGSVASVSWRAIVRETSRDLLANSVTIGQGDDASAWLQNSALPLPQFLGDESRGAMSARLRYERQRAARPRKLAARIESLQASATGRRVEAVGKVGHAVSLLLAGYSLDSAAVLAGFKARNQGRGGNVRRAGDALAQAVRRLGFKFQISLRQTGDGFARPSMG